MRLGTEEGGNRNKSEISLKRDQWSGLEKKLIELNWVGKRRKENNSWMEESIIEKE